MRIWLVVMTLALVIAGCGGQATSEAAVTQPASAIASVSPSEEPSLSASPSAVGTPTPADDLLAPGMEAEVVVDSLLLRESPGTDRPIVVSMPRGSIVYLSGPPFARSVDGIEWRYLLYEGTGAQDVVAGWAATKDAENPYLLPVPVDCPTDPPDAATLAGMTDWAHLACFGDREMVIEGTVVTGFGGYAPGEYEPYWLAGPFGFSGAIDTDGGLLFYHLDGGGQTGYLDGQRLRITGHYDDPAASTCTIASGEPAVPEPDALAVAYCRARFVVTDIVEI